MTFLLTLCLTYLLTFFLTYLLTVFFWHSFWHSISRLRSGREHWAQMVVVEVWQGTLAADGRGWGPAGNTGCGWARLRRGREHWAEMVAVEVRQGTLAADGRGWGVAGNTGLRWSRLRSGREHWPRMGAVEAWQGTLGWDGRGWGPAGNANSRWSWEDEDDEDKQADIKSNNPHLTGGESGKQRKSVFQTRVNRALIQRNAGILAWFPTRHGTNDEWWLPILGG